MLTDFPSYKARGMSNKFDVVIVGGGIIGLSCAHYLQKDGARVLVIDRGRYTEGASTGNAGMIVPSHIVPLSAPGVIAKGIKWLMNPESPLYIKPSTDRHFMKWLWLFQKHCTPAHVRYAAPILRDMSLSSSELLTEMCDLPGFADVGLRHDGLLMLHNSDETARANEELADMAQEAGLEVDRLDREGTLGLEPALKTQISGSVFFRQDTSIHPELLLRALESHVRAGGVEIREGEVTSMNSGGRTVSSVTADGEDITADHFVLAAGSWTPHLTRSLGLNLPVQPAKGYSVTVPLEKCDSEADAPRLKIPCVVTDEKLTITPMPGCIRFGGTLALEGFDSSIDERRVRPIRHQAALYCRDIGDIQTWSGFRPASPDGLPYIGLLPKARNVLVATGHGMMGVTHGPITGQLVAQMIAERTPSLNVEPFRANR